MTLAIVVVQFSIIVLFCPSRQEKPETGKPKISVRINGEAKYTRDRTVTLTFTKGGKDSPATEMALSSDGKSWGAWRPFAEMTKFELPDGDGEKTVYIKFSDRAGNVSEIASAKIILDQTPPSAKVTCPPVVAENRLLLSSEMPDAVGMQFTENSDAWNLWEPYSSLKSLSLSSGEGKKNIYARFRDEAGNVSEFVRLDVEVNKEASLAAPYPKLRAVTVVTSARNPTALDVHLSIEAVEMAEMEFQVDGNKPTPRSCFSELQDFALARVGTAHRIRIRLWDAPKNEYAAIVAFQEEEFPPDRGDQSLTTNQAGPFFARVSTGLWTNGPGFVSQTTIGSRKLNSGALAIAEVEVGMTVADPLFVDVFGEYVLGNDASITSLGLKLGSTIYQGPLVLGNGSLEIRGGAFFSNLNVDVSGFGRFDPGFGFQIEFGGRFDLTERLSLDAGAGFRSVSYKWSGETISGDTHARSSGAELLLGLSSRF